MPLAAGGILAGLALMYATGLVVGWLCRFDAGAGQLHIDFWNDANCTGKVRCGPQLTRDSGTPLLARAMFSAPVRSCRRGTEPCAPAQSTAKCGAQSVRRDLQRARLRKSVDERSCCRDQRPQRDVVHSVTAAVADSRRVDDPEHESDTAGRECLARGTMSCGKQARVPLSKPLERSVVSRLLS